MHDVVVIGAGPVGLLLAGELARRGVEVEVLERRPGPGNGTRAIGVHAPVLAALETSGLTERLLADAVRVHRGEARSAGRLLGVVRFDRLSARFPFVATLPQAATEAALAAVAPPPFRGARVTEILQRADGVRVRAAAGGRAIELTCRILVVAGGASARDLVYRRGAVRPRDYPDRYLMTDAEAGPRADAEVAVVHLDRSGVLESFPLPDGLRRFVAWDGAEKGTSGAAGADGVEEADGADGEDDAARRRVERLRTALRQRGEHAAADAVAEASAFGVRRFVAPRLRNGRVVAIGDTAHEVSPIGGQGMNLGLLDAVTLAPLLAQWIRTGDAPTADLARWEAKRVGSARRAARLAAANTALGRAVPGPLDAGRRGLVRAMLAPPMGRLFASAYAMGLDRGA